MDKLIPHQRLLYFLSGFPALKKPSQALGRFSIPFSFLAVYDEGFRADFGFQHFPCNGHGDGRVFVGPKAKYGATVVEPLPLRK